MSIDLTIEIYQQDGVTPAMLLAHPFFSHLRFSSQVPGGFAGCSFDLPIPVAVEHPELEFNNKVKVRSRTNKLVWEGRVEDLTLRKAGDEEGVTVGCLGPYTAMNDRLYNYVWVDRRADQWWWPEATGVNEESYNAWHRADMYRNYRTQMVSAPGGTPNDVLGIEALDGKLYGYNVGAGGGIYAMWKWEAPSGQTVKRITFDYATFFPQGSWRLGIFRETTPAVEGTPITASGSGSVDRILATSSQRIWLFMQAMAENDLTRGFGYLHTNAAFTYTGAGWTIVTDNTCRTGSQRRNPGTDAAQYMEFTFTGTGYILMGHKKGDAGKVDVSRKRGAGAYSLDTSDTGVSGDDLDLYADPDQLSVRVFGRTNLDWDTYTVKVQMTNTKNAASGGYLFRFDYALVTQRCYAEVSNVVVYCNPDASTAIPVTADRVIKHTLTQSCPDIDTDQSGIGAPGATLAQAVYLEDLRPSEVAERLAALGDGAGVQWEIAVWDDWKAEFAARPTAVTHQVQLEGVELDLRKSIEGMWNRTYGTYSDDRGNPVHTPVYNDADSQAKYGLVREHAAPVGRAGLTEAGLAGTVALAAYKDPGAQGTITVKSNLYTAEGLLVPLEEFRAGSVLRMSGLIPHEGIQGVVDNKTVFYIVQADYDASSGVLTLTPGELPAGLSAPYRGIGPTLMG